jgi:hypothetical protein
MCAYCVIPVFNGFSNSCDHSYYVHIIFSLPHMKVTVTVMVVMWKTFLLMSPEVALLSVVEISDSDSDIQVLQWVEVKNSGEPHSTNI